MEMRNIGRFATQRGVEADTCMEEATLQHLADTYGHVVHPNRTRARWKRALYFYVYFMWLNLGLTPEAREQWAGVQNAGEDWDGLSKSAFKKNVVPVGDALAAIIAEIVYDDRRA